MRPVAFTGSIVIPLSGPLDAATEEALYTRLLPADPVLARSIHRAIAWERLGRDYFITDSFGKRSAEADAAVQANAQQLGLNYAYSPSYLDRAPDLDRFVQTHIRAVQPPSGGAMVPDNPVKGIRKTLNLQA